MPITNKDIKRKIIEISYRNKLSHIGSCLEASDIIVDIFNEMDLDKDIFVLSQGHAGLAYYVVAEKYLGINAEQALIDQGIHPDRQSDTQNFVSCSTGSLGMGLPIAVGMALASPDKNIHCLISDGEMSEGSLTEALDLEWLYMIENLYIYLNANGYGGYSETDKGDWYKDIYSRDGVYETDVDYLPFLKGLEGHYHVMSQSDYDIAMEVLDG